MDNNSFLNHLEALCNALKEGNKEMVMLKLKQVEVYFAEYKPDLWSIRVQGLLQSLLGVTSNIVTPDDMPSTFTSYNEADITPDTYIPELPNIHFTTEVSTPLIFELIEKANIQLSTGEKNDVLYLVREYSRLTDVEGKMSYKPPFKIGTDERFLDVLHTGETMLRQNYNFFMDTIKQPSPAQSKKSFKSTLTEAQKVKLHKALIDNGYIDKATDEANFKAVFSGSLPDDFEPVKWIDRDVKKHEPNARTLFELLYLLKRYIDKENFDTTANNEYNLYRLINNCFAAFKHLSEKNQHKAEGNTPRKALLKTMVDGLS